MQILCISVGPVHTTMGAIIYWSALVRSKKPVGREVAFTQGYGKNPVNWSRIGPKFGKVNQKSGRFTNVPFHSRVNRKGRSSSGLLSGPVGFLQVHASVFHLLSLLHLLTLSQYIRETLFSCRCFFIFRNKLLNCNFCEPQNSFF